MNDEELMMETTVTVEDYDIPVEESTDLINVDDVQEKPEIGLTELGLIGLAGVGFGVSIYGVVKGGKWLFKKTKAGINKLFNKKQDNEEEEEDAGDLKKVNLDEEEAVEDKKGKKK